MYLLVVNRPTTMPNEGFNLQQMSYKTLTNPKYASCFGFRQFVNFSYFQSPTVPFNFIKISLVLPTFCKSRKLQRVPFHSNRNRK